ncbi:MarR family transcriptional regulator [Amycolatopsis sp. PS_44_ISF1]|uniref:MarR family transcriptional regulator n=1 Tax=Amycolatopsis sp. PS_44_ISF1 TaxID=2974917 RepID=UPI0028DD557B|nr:MarR family transcriptional regulator [Amycolatopsis sp. PS_44_ISF1]MDT8912998.1 MarR family transcriptional regulator [Amycolatopsis sp. PS_44_ISF1]
MPPKPPPDAAAVSRELRSLVGRLRRRLRELHGPEDLAPGLLSVLLRLEQDGPATASVLAAAEKVRTQSMAAKLAELEQRGLIVRRPHPSDGRQRVVDLTAPGRARVEGDRFARREWLAQALQDRYSEAERARLMAAFALLERLFED